MDGRAGSPRVIELSEAARLLSMSTDGVHALAAAGYLTPVDADRFALGDVKALHARMTDDVAAPPIFDDPARVDPQALLDALDGKSEDMARRAFDIFQTVFPEATRWSVNEQARFIDQAKRRFEAILAVTAHGEAVDLAGDLAEVGAAAAWAGSSLPQLLVVLRISRDLVVQTAVEVAEERGRHWGLALSLVLTRVLPAVDRLTDAVAQGYWEAVVGREEEDKARYESVCEHVTDGVYELDFDGRVQYANASLALVLGRRLFDLHGAHISEVLVPVVGTLDACASDRAPQRAELTIVRPDGVERELEVLTFPRFEGDELAGFQGIVRDRSAVTELEQQRSEFLGLITHDLRQPLTAVLGLGATLEGFAAELPAERLAHMGTSIRQQSERMARLADDLYEVSRMESASGVLLNLRAVEVRRVVDGALGALDGTDDVRLEVPDDLVVQADVRRLEQVVANLVENALTHGAAPVVVRAVPSDDLVELVVTDAGRGVDPGERSTLFTRLRTRGEGAGSRGGGLGLPLVRGLVEAMGGRVWYDEGPSGGASFHLTLATPRVFADRSESP
jgi:PAS domain S-box-containing protein